jgi:uncharacterized membrane protein YphA (DoxX/SURF4 family)/uncharacterized membrane protein
MPSDVIGSYSAFALVLAVGLAAIFARKDWQNARGFDKLVLFGPLFYAAPVAGFGVEHFTLTRGIASLVPSWIPLPMFWTYWIGACFIGAAFSLVTRIGARISASLLALTFFLFVVLMDIPGWLRRPADPFALTLVLRELAFCGGPLALAVALTAPRRRIEDVLAIVAPVFVAVPILFYSFEQFVHPDHVPAIPLQPLRPDYVFGGAMWAYLAAVSYAIAGALLLIGKKSRGAAIWLGATVFVVVLAVYVPMAIVERASLKGFNFLADTLMFCGTILLVASAMPDSSKRPAGTPVAAL